MKQVTIALVWHQMNSDNLGVGALTVANIEILRTAAEMAGCKPRFLVVGWRDPRPWYGAFDDVENVPIRTRHLVSLAGPFAEAIRRSDIVFDIGGGDSFTDIYGAKRFFTIWVTKLRSLIARKPLVLAPQTFGPFDKALTRALARWVMKRSRAVVSRDAPSTEFLLELGVNDGLLEATDVAMRLSFDRDDATARDGRVRVGLNVSGLLMNGGYTGANQFGLSVDYPKVVREIIRHFVNLETVDLHLIGHVQSQNQPVEDDQRASEALAKEFSDVVVAPVFHSPWEAKSYIAGMDFFVGSRMHATIAAISSGVPVVPLAYSRKFQGVFGTLGYDHVADCKSDSEEVILRKVSEGFEKRDQLAAEGARAMDQVDARLDRYTQLAADVIGEVLN